MKKINIILLLALSMLMMVGCSKPPKPTQIKWIDDEDLLYIVDNPAVSKWKKKLGMPFAVEFQNDTTTYYYYYHPMMFNAVDKGKTYKPTDEDRYVNYWSDRTNLVALSVLADKVVRIDVKDPIDPEKAKTLHPARRSVRAKTEDGSN